MRGTESRLGRRSSATIYDVADHAGVSPMTVSRVIAGGKNVRKDKIERVQASILELGYRRNENARSIRPGQRTGQREDADERKDQCPDRSFTHPRVLPPSSGCCTARNSPRSPRCDPPQ